MKKMLVWLLAAVLLCSCAAAEPASIVETGAGMKKKAWRRRVPDLSFSGRRIGSSQLVP